MYSAPTLFSIAVAQFQPEHLKLMLKEMEQKKCKIRFAIIKDIKNYDTSIEKMINHNKRCDGWPDYPQKTAFYTIEADKRNRNVDPRWLRK